jgi:hypothetical protein
MGWSARQAPLHGVRPASVSAVGDDTEVGARLLQRLHVDVRLFSRLLDIAHAPRAMGERVLEESLRALARRSVFGDVSRAAVSGFGPPLRRASRARSARVLTTVALLTPASLARALVVASGLACSAARARSRRPHRPNRKPAGGRVMAF